MSCSIISDTIKITMDGETAHKTLSATPVPGYRSALQNPDISKVQLETLLRRQARPGAATGRSQKNFWSAFMTQYRSSHANGNND
jgi:hypothetical protein